MNGFSETRVLAGGGLSCGFSRELSWARAASASAANRQPSIVRPCDDAVDKGAAARHKR